MNDYDNSNNNKKILLVDDEPDITLYFSLVLKDSGFLVDAFNDPEFALSTFKSNMYDVAILDIRMPKINGFELASMIKKIDKKIKLVFITAHDIDKEELEKENVRGLFVGNREKPLIMRKPIYDTEFLSQINEVLRE